VKSVSTDGDECFKLRPSCCAALCHACQKTIDSEVHVVGHGAIAGGIFCSACCPVHNAQLQPGTMAVSVG
jgi:hypothetical protein